jgi:hypothetical protein
VIPIDVMDGDFSRHRASVTITRLASVWRGVDRFVTEEARLPREKEVQKFSSFDQVLADAR